MTNADQKLSTIGQKIKRAKKHLSDLEAERDRFFANNACAVESYEDPQTGERIFKMLHVSPVSVDFLLTLGDALHNTRSALDHLAWQLVAPAKRGTGTYFPIFDDAAKCKTTDLEKKQSFSADAAKRIKNAQPYKGGRGHYLWVLNKLDNADKHRELLTSIVCMSHSMAGRGANVASVQSVTFWAGQTIKMGEPLKTGDTFLILPKEYKNVEFAFDIGISEPSIIGNIPVIFWLGNAIYTVERLIQSFKPDLK